MTKNASCLSSQRYNFLKANHNIFGAGYYDEGDGHNAEIRKNVNKMYKQQERNNL